MDLSIVILSFNSNSDLERLLPSIFASAGEFSYEVIVVDNGSTDGTVDSLQRLKDLKYKDLKIIANQNNGFSHGNNLGIKQAQGKYILILNPDTELKPETLEVMLEFMEAHSDVGISTCKVMLPDGRLDLACRRRFPNPWNSFKRLFLLSNRDYNYANADADRDIEIESCMGAFMFARKSVLLQVEGFDEDFFMYGEDLDLCWRVKELGFKVWYYPQTTITHYKGSSSKKVPYSALKWFHDAMWIFYKKHYGRRYPFWFGWMVWLGIYFRLVALWLISFLRKEKFVSK